MNFDIVNEFEKEIALFFGSKYAVCLDSCTHGLELCIRLKGLKMISVPRHTYISVPFLANKLSLDLEWRDEEWVNFYRVDNGLSPVPIYDAAVLWKENSYINGSFMCLSFQYQKHLSLGRGGAILVDDFNDFQILKKMSYDGRIPGIPWRQQDISVIGYHYYMTPETAELGLTKLNEAKLKEPRIWSISDWPDLSAMTVFR